MTATVASGQSATLVVSGGAITFGSTPAACGDATTSNTDLISIAGTAGTVETLVLDMSAGAFAPGATTEATGTSEIEIATTLGDATDLVTVKGTPGDDTMRIGSNGVGFNADDDVDVSFSPLPVQVELYGLGGANFLSARGGAGTGTVYSGKAVLRAGNDPGNTLEGGNGNDDLHGGASGDNLEGINGNDWMSGGGGNDVLLGGGGNDTMIGGAGSDQFLASAGDDFMYADDDEADAYINGGAGIDTGYYDSGIDPVPTATENRIPA